MDGAGKKGRGYQDSVGSSEKRAESRESESRPESACPEKYSSTREQTPPINKTHSLQAEERASREGSAENESRFSFGFSKKKTTSEPPKTDPPEGEPDSKNEGPEEDRPGPPPLMSRQRELMTKAFGGDSDSEEEEGVELTRMAVRGTSRFMFKIRKI